MSVQADEAELERLHGIIDTLEELHRFKPDYEKAFKRFIEEHARVPITHSGSDARSTHTRSSLRCLQAAEELGLPLKNTALKQDTLRAVVDEALDAKRHDKEPEGPPDIFADANNLALARACESRREPALRRRVTGHLKRELAKPHPNAYLVLFAQNALDGNAMRAKVSQAALTVLQDQLVFHSAHMVLQFDPAALAASAVLLSRARPSDFPTGALPPGGADQIIRRAAEILLLSDGLKPGMRAPRPQSENQGDGVIHTVRYEDLLIISHLPLRYMPPAMDAIQNAVRHLREQFGQYPSDDAGWTLESDRAYPQPMSWITAIYSQLLVRSERLLSHAYTEGYLHWTAQGEGKRVQRGADGSDPARAWKDVLETEQNAKQLIQDKILGSAKPVTKPRGRSLLLFGPPGTSKTTLVRSLAGQLRRAEMASADKESWPVLTVNPADVLGDGGYSQLVNNLRRLFREIRALSEVVVFFDEAENLVFGRALEGESREDRMITASMLPLLNDIDSENILFVMATNYVREIDLAVRRRGRFALRVGVGGPAETGRQRLIRETLLPALKSQLDVRRLAEITRFLTIREVLAVSEELNAVLRDCPPERDVGQEAEAIVRRARHSAELTPQIRNDFEEDLEAYHDGDLPLDR